MNYHGPSCLGKCTTSPLCACEWTSVALTPELAEHTRILLGSTSSYRAELLSRLRQPFIGAAPDCDETPRSGELPAKLAERLATGKASSLVGEHPAKIIIGSDQVAAVGNEILGKPGTVANAHDQLERMQGRAVVFYTAVCVIDNASGTTLEFIDKTTATLRALTTEEIVRYVAMDNPLDCAGSFKVESLGVSLFERVETQDPTALVGLPLIELCGCLRELGVAVP